MRRIGLASLLLLIVSGACQSEKLAVVDECWMDPAPIWPRPGTLLVGDTVTLTARLGEPRKCLPGNLKPVVWRWTSRDPAIATVDSVSGLVTARAPGEVWIEVHHARVARVASHVTVRVAAR